MPISGEQKRLEIIRSILQEHSFLSEQANNLVKLSVTAEDADDCAVYDLPGNLSLVVGMDFIRGTGFKLFQENYLNYYDVGYYLIVANLSDIAAMGATPIGLTTVIRYTNTLEDEAFSEIVQGMQGAATHYNTPIVGGDIGGYEEIVLAATALGIAQTGKYLTRKGAQPGDALCVTGDFGLPSTALVYFTRAKKQGFTLTEEEEKTLLASWKRPIAHLPEGIALANLGLVHACQDVSDGGKATIDQLGIASNVAFEVNEDSLPIHPITRKVATFLNVDSTALALSASVDFQLMFCVPESAVGNVETVLQAIPNCNLSVIGHAIPPSGPSHMIRLSKEVTTIPGTAWNQQTSDVTKVVLGEA